MNFDDFAQLREDLEQNKNRDWIQKLKAKKKSYAKYIFISVLTIFGTSLLVMLSHGPAQFCGFPTKLG